MAYDETDEQERSIGDEELIDQEFSEEDDAFEDEDDSEDEVDDETDE